jgi:hypothetical protein
MTDAAATAGMGTAVEYMNREIHLIYKQKKYIC